MQYFFDESGKWSGGERHILVLGGLMVNSDIALNKLQTEFKMLKSEHGLSYLHANEMSPAALEHTYAVIDSLLTEDANAMLRIYNHRIVNSKSKLSAEDVYIEMASDVVATLIYGDKNPKINYDMQFYHAYPENTIAETERTKELYYIKMMRSFNLLEESLKKEKDRIIKKLSNEKIANRTWAKDYLSYINECPKKAVSQYLWAELIMQIQGNENAKESFRSNIMSNLRNINKLTGSTAHIPDLNMRFLPKDAQNAGVETIDILCNLIYKNGLQPSENAPSRVKLIYSKITVEEMK